MRITKCENVFLVQITGLKSTFVVNSWSDALEIAWRLGGGKYE